MGNEISQEEAKIRVALKREIRKASNIYPFPELRTIPTEKLRKLLKGFNNNN